MLWFLKQLAPSNPHSCQRGQNNAMEEDRKVTKFVKKYMVTAKCRSMWPTDLHGTYVKSRRQKNKIDRTFFIKTYSIESQWLIIVHMVDFTILSFITSFLLISWIEFVTAFTWQLATKLQNGKYDR